MVAHNTFSGFTHAQFGGCILGATTHIMTEDGPMSKRMVTHWEELPNLFTCCITANTTIMCGVVDREWLIVACWKESVRMGWTWPELPSEVEGPIWLTVCIQMTYPHG
jgi:hypothetical protein